MNKQQVTSALTPFRIALIYAMFGGMWILFSDVLLAQISPNVSMVTFISIVKGWLYVLVTSLLLYWLIRRYATSRELTESALKESEQRFRTIFNSVNDAIFVHDLKTGDILDVNERMCELFGYSHYEALRLDIEAISSGGPVYNQKVAIRWMKKTVEAGPQLFEWCCKKKSGSLFWVEINMRQATIGKFEHILVTVRDISERKKAMEAEIAREAAEAASTAKSDFLATMSHELRTPLNCIIGFSEIMRDGFTGEISARQKEFMDHIYESGNHLLSLINDVLDLSKIEAGRMDIKSDKFFVDELINSSLSLFKDKALNQSLKITTETEEGLGTMSADVRLLKQVLFNLIGNAMKFTHREGVIHLKVRKGDADFIEFSVADTGIGISLEDQNKLFKPFQQLDNSYNRKYSGTGLGLSICKKIIELHGGKIWLESEPGKGSRFTFVIPLVRDNKITKATKEEDP